MKTFRLKDDHEFHLRVQELMDKADELGISIDFSACNCRTFITDERTGKEYDLNDSDDNQPVTCFPAYTEYKITYDKK